MVREEEEEEEEEEENEFISKYFAEWNVADF